MKKILIILSIVFLALTGCEMELPNPIIGTYVLPSSEDGSLILSGYSFKEDNSFTYFEVIFDKDQATDKKVLMEGTYSMDLDAFGFVNASGNIVFKVDNVVIPEGTKIGNLYMGKGANAFLFDWTCDRNNGPQGMTLVKNPYVSQENLELKYVGGPDKLEGFI